MASICGERIQYLRIGFPVLEMTSEFDKRFRKWPQHFGKWLRYMGHVLSV